MADGLDALQTVGVLERDGNQDVMFTWSYPDIDDDTRTVLLTRSGLEEYREKVPSALLREDEGDNEDEFATDEKKQGQLVPFSFSKFNGMWLYVVSQAVSHPSPDDGAEEDEDPLPRVVAVSICLTAKDYHPEMYAALGTAFMQQYLRTGSPLPLLRSFLSVLMQGRCRGAKDNEAEMFESSAHDVRKAYLSTPFKALVRMFGLEIVLLWTALMMKKRVAVYSEELPPLLRVIRGFPLLVWHRRDFDTLYPYTRLSCELEVKELQSAMVYTAGFTDPEILGRDDMYDLLVDVNARSISVAGHAKGDFRLGAFHKDLATWMTSTAEDDDVTDQDLLRDLAKRTRDFIARLSSLQVDVDGVQCVTLENLQERNLPANMDRFLYAVASAEGMTSQASAS